MGRKIKDVYANAKISLGNREATILAAAKSAARIANTKGQVMQIHFQYDDTKEKVTSFVSKRKLDAITKDHRGIIESPKMTIDFGKGCKVSVTKGRKTQRHLGDGEYIMSARIRIKDGTEYDGYVLVSAPDGGEHCGTMLWDENGNFHQDTDIPTMLKNLGKTKAEFFPYAYNYKMTGASLGYDHHVDENTGWSR